MRLKTLPIAALIAAISLAPAQADPNTRRQQEALIGLLLGAAAIGLIASEQKKKRKRATVNTAPQINTPKPPLIKAHPDQRRETVTHSHRFRGSGGQQLSHRHRVPKRMLQNAERYRKWHREIHRNARTSHRH